MTNKKAYTTHNPEGMYFVTLTVVEWVDVFTHKEHKMKIVDSLQYCQKHKGLIIHAWVLMSNHLHMLISSKEGFHLSDILRDFKKFTAKQIIKAIEEEPESRRDWLLYRFEYAGKFKSRIKKYKFWQDGNHAKEVFSYEFMMQKLNYIHQNPVKALIVAEAEHYLFSSARNYAKIRDSLIEVELV